MKITIILLFAFLSVNCQTLKTKKIKYPEGDKILYSEFTGLQTQRLVLYSLKNNKEYEIPYKMAKSIYQQAVFSPDGNNILIKDLRSTDGFYIYNLVTSEVQTKILPSLNIPDEEYIYEYYDDNTVVFQGIYNLYLISLRTEQLEVNIAYTDTFKVLGFDTNFSKKLLLFNYGSDDAPFNNESAKTIIYNLHDKKCVGYFENTHYSTRWIPGTEELYYIEDKTPVVFNIKTKEKKSIKFENVSYDTINYSGSQFIDKNRFLIMMKGKNQYENDFYIYNFMDKSLKQITDTKTWKSLMGIYFK